MRKFLMQEGDKGLVNGGVAAKMPHNVSYPLKKGEKDTDDLACYNVFYEKISYAGRGQGSCERWSSGKNAAQRFLPPEKRERRTKTT
jgi:hypothetical protein